LGAARIKEVNAAAQVKLHSAIYDLTEVGADRLIGGEP
jgi:hypothetical protein